ncbi:hypothetical protein V1517DRAFT_313934 [Lipomyces orientalis]|uniref:Uncharacterized protein n=1 Tax=Lipomyces orientalis TaxID=1233043 RepID=A0ACC3TXU7_9ASCO
MTGRPKVLIISDITESNPTYIEFSKKFECIRYVPTTKEQLLTDLQSEKLRDITAIWAMWFGFAELGGTIEKDVFEAIPPSVKVVSIAPVGYDRYDIDFLTKRGIILTNNPGLGADAVADIALFLVLATFRFTTVLEHSLRKERQVFRSREVLNSDKFVNGIPSRREENVFGFGNNIGGRTITSPGGKRCGVVGVGAIGKEIIRRVVAFGMSAHYYTRTPLPSETLATLPASSMTAYSSLDELLPNCDVIVLCVPLSVHTYHILNSKTLALLPQGARVVNVGRGGLIDSDALVAALDSGHLTSAGLDVFEGEPQIPEILLDRWDITILPHIGSATQETVISAENGIMRNIENVVLEGGSGITPVNMLS